MFISRVVVAADPYNGKYVLNVGEDIILPFFDANVTKASLREGGGNPSEPKVSDAVDGRSTRE